MTTRQDIDEHPERYLQVCAEPCDECLLSSNAIVSDARRRELLQLCTQDRQIGELSVQGSYFICHKHSLRVMNRQATEAQGRVCCRRFFDIYGKNVLVIRLARTIGNIVFVDLDGNPVEGKHV